MFKAVSHWFTSEMLYICIALCFTMELFYNGFTMELSFLYVCFVCFYFKNRFLEILAKRNFSFLIFIFFNFFKKKFFLKISTPKFLFFCCFPTDFEFFFCMLFRKQVATKLQSPFFKFVSLFFDISSFWVKFTLFSLIFHK